MTRLFFYALVRIAFGTMFLSAVDAAQDYVISTFAGGGAPAAPGVAVDTAIGAPMGVVTDAAGNVYFASPDVNAVFELSPSGVLTRLAGNSRPGYSGDGAQAASALLNSPQGLAVDAAGNLFIADTGNSRVRKVSPNGIITTVAGIGAPGFSGDGGPAVSAQLSAVALTADSAGNLFIAGDYRVRKVAPSGIITTVAGNGNYYFSGDGGPATSAALVAEGVAVDSANNLFIADSLHVRKVSPDGIITTVAGNGTEGFSGDGEPATAAPLRAWGLAVDEAGGLLIAALCSIRKVTADGIIHTVAGTCMGGPQSGDGGPATSAQLSGAFGVALDGAGNLFIADASNGRIRKVSTGGIIATVAGNGTLGPSLGGPSFSGDGGPATSAQLNYPSGVAVDGGQSVPHRSPQQPYPPGLSGRDYHHGCRQWRPRLFWRWRACSQCSVAGPGSIGPGWRGQSVLRRFRWQADPRGLCRRNNHHGCGQRITGFPPRHRRWRSRYQRPSEWLHRRSGD